MKKNILVLTGSPRKGGNSDMLADAFIRGAEAQGHRAVKFMAGEQRINGCKACDTCWSTGRPCTFDDDFNLLAPHLEEADVLVFVTPLYWFSFSAQLKATIDKFYAYLMPGAKPLKIKETMLLACAMTEQESEFNGLMASFEEIARYMKWEERGLLLVTGVAEKGDVAGTEALHQAEKMGQAI